MADGYFWAHALLFCSMVAAGLATVCGLLSAILWRRQPQRKWTAFFTAAIAAVLLLSAAGLFYQSRFSTVRHTLDRIDAQVLAMIDNQMRACYLLANIAELREDGERFNRYWSLARTRVSTLQQPLVNREDLAFLSSTFVTSDSVSEAEILDLVFHVGGLIGIFYAGLFTIITVGFWGSRALLGPVEGPNVGALIAVFAILAYPVLRLMLQNHSQINPLILTLVFPIAVAAILHACGRKPGLRPINFGGSLTLLLACGLFSFATAGMIKAGEKDLARYALLLETDLPTINRRADSLDEALAQFEQNGFDHDNFNTDGVCYSLYIAVGSFEEKRANLMLNAFGNSAITEPYPFINDFHQFTDQFERGN